MIRIIIAAALLLACTIQTEARQRHRPIVAHEQCNLPGPNSMPCEGVAPSPRGEKIAKQMGFGASQKIYTPRVVEQPRKQRVRTARRPQASTATHRAHTVHHRYIQPITTKPSPNAEKGKSLDGVVPMLAEKVRDIVSTCGSTVWSAVRHTYIAGTRIISQHASGTAVDVHGNPGCIYAMLRGWPGGYSTDYGRVNHVHISYGGREHGARFVHGGHRYARRHHRHTRYAAAR